MAIVIMELIFGFRPIIDLFWEWEIISGVNLAGLTALLVLALTAVFFAGQKRIPMPFMAGSAILVVAYTGFMTTVYAGTVNDFIYVTRLASGTAFLFVVAPYISKKRVERCLQVFILATTVPIFITFLQSAGVVEYTYFDSVGGAYFGRGSGGYLHPSVLTRFCVFGILYVLYFLETKWRDWRKRLFAYIYILLNITAVSLSYHRMGYLQTICIPGLWFLLRYKEQLYKYLVRILAACAAVSMLFYILYMCGIFSIDLTTFQRLVSLDNVFLVRDGKWTLILRGRDSMINILVASFLRHPWYNILFGNGVNINASSGLSMATADMELIRVLWNCGLIGGMVWLLHLRDIWKSLRSVGIALQNNALYQLGVCVFVSYLLWGVTLETSETPNILYHLYLVCGYAYYSGRKAQGSESASPKTNQNW